MMKSIGKTSLTLLTLASLVACEAVDSVDVMTDGVYADITAEADGDGAATDGDARSTQAPFLQGTTRYRQHPLLFFQTLLNYLRQVMVVYKVHVVGTLSASRHTSLVLSFLRYVATPGNTSRLGLQLVRWRRGTAPAVGGPS